MLGISNMAGKKLGIPKHIYRLKIGLKELDIYVYLNAKIWKTS